jgi:flagellar basal-body rod modification protein FlgD
MDISSIVSKTNTTDFLNPGEPTRTTGQNTLGVNDFLKLITVQLTSQDPLKPMEDTQFISQMSSFTSLEQMKGLSKNFEEFATEQRIASSQNYLGKEVSVSDGDTVANGVVSKVTLIDGKPELTINGKAYSAGDVTSVKIPAPSA